MTKKSSSKQIVKESSMATKVLLTLALGFGLTMGASSAMAEGTVVQPAAKDDGNKVVVTADGWTLDGNKQSGASPYSSVYGGYSGSSAANNNILRITGGIFTDYIFGGYGDGADNNIVLMTGGTSTGWIYGGYNAIISSVSNNAVVIGGTASVIGKTNSPIVGGSGDSNDTGNLVQISTSGEIDVGRISGGAGNGANTLIIGSTNVTATNVENFTTYAFAIPDTAKNGDTLLDNSTSFSLSGGTVYVTPKYSTEGYTINLANASNCSTYTPVLASGNTVSGSVSKDGDYIKYTQTGITSWTSVQPSSLTDNVVVVDGSKNTSDKAIATVNGGTQAVISSEVSDWQYVYGGYSTVPGAYVMDNEVTISGGTVSAKVYGGFSENGTVMGNRVIVIDGSITGRIYGAYTSKEEASGNSVVIKGGTLSDNVYGGFSSTSYASKNSVVLMDSPIFNGTRQIGGGFGSDNSNDYNTVQLSTANANGLDQVTIFGGSGTDNTLIVDTKGVTVAGVVKFDTYAFYVPADAGTTALLTNGGTTSVDLTGQTVYVVPSVNGGTVSSATLMSGSVGGDPTLKHDLASGNEIEDGSLSYSGSTLTYTGGTITKWHSVQPSSLTGNTVELVARDNGKAAAKVTNGENTITQVLVDSDSPGENWNKVYGGYSTMQGAYVANNTVTISSTGGIEGDDTSIYGGYAPNGTVENNTLNVTVSGVNVELVDGFDTYNFTLPSSGTTMLTLNALGDDFQGDTITVTTNGNSNTVTLFSDYFASSLDNITFKVDGETVTGTDLTDCFKVAEVEGGSGTYKLTFQNNLSKSIIPTAKTSNNTVVVTGDRSGTIDGVEITDVPKEDKTWKDVYGGYSEESGAVVQNNKLTIQAGTISGNVYAGYAPNGTAKDNTLTWTGGTIKGSTIQGNEITITGTGATYLGNEGTITAKTGTTLKPVELTGTLTVGDASTASKLTFASGVNIGKDGILVLEDAQGTTTGSVILQGTSTLSGTIKGEVITNGGTLNIDAGEKKTFGTAIEGTGTLVVKSGTDLVYEGASITNAVTIEYGATMDPDAGVYKSEVTNKGTLVLEGGTAVTTFTNISGSTLQITSPVTISSVSGSVGSIALESGSTLSLSAAVCATEAAIKGVAGNAVNKNLTIVNGVTIQLTGETDDDVAYKLFEGDETVLLTLTDAVKNGLVGDDGEFSEVESSVTNNTLSVKVSNITNDEMAINRLAGVQQGMVSMQNLTNDAVMGHIGLVNKAKAEGKYSKEVWASYLRNKDSVDGYGGGLGDYTAQYNGVTVGLDFYSSEKSLAGVALTYANGDNDGIGEKSAIRNESKYYGIELYDRVDLKNNSALLLDLGYMNGKNETCVTRKSVTADAKVNSYTLGVRYEKEFALGGSKLVPFAGVRYLRLQNSDFSNSRGLSYSTNSQNLFQPKIGLAWTGDYKMSKSDWNFKPKAEIGYLWALGNREADTTLTYRGKDKGNILYDVTDHSSYYAKFGMEFIKSNFAFGVDYSYMKGDTVRSNKWNVNVSWSF